MADIAHTTSTSRRTMLRGLATLPLAVSGGAALAVDPIFAAIEKHRAAHLAANAPMNEDERGNFACRELDVCFEMHETVATTIAGLAAYVAYWEAFQARFSLEGVNDAALSNIAASLVRLAPSNA